MNIPGFLRTKFGYKKVETIKVDGQKVERLDSWLPQGLRIGSIVTLNENWFSINQAFGGSAPTPETMNHTVKMISSLVINSGIKLVRAYLTDDLYIQFTMQFTQPAPLALPLPPSAYKLIEIHLFQVVFTDFPTDWESVLGPDGLGQYIFTDNDGHEFHRVTGNGDYCEPQSAVERGISDAAGQTGWVTDINYHLYERQLDATSTESLLIQVEEVREQNGQPGDSAYVSFAVGIDLPTTTSFIPTNS